MPRDLARTRCSARSGAPSRRPARRARSRPGGRAPTAGSASRRASRRPRRSSFGYPSSRSSARCVSARSRIVNSGKSSPYALARRGVGRARPGRALAAAEEVRADDVEAVGVDRLAGPDQRVPPVAGLGVAGQRVADVDRRGATGRRSARRRSPAARAARRTRASDRPGERAFQPRVRREEMTPVSKPARCRPPWKRACSIFTQRLETTSRPAA